MLRTAHLVALMVVFAAPPALAQPAERVALVIGESAYQTVSPLENPSADARLVADALARSGFDVRLGLDLDKEALETAIDDFAHDAQQADVAAVYFAGHGFEADGRNWLVPVDAVIESADDVARAAIPFEVVARSLAGAKIKLIALDACRDNPFAARVAAGGVINRGLGEVELDGTVVLYAAGAGEVALDGTTNSPFAQSFARRLSESDVDLRLVAGRVRDDVIATTGAAQRPFVSASLSGDVTVLPLAPPGSVRAAVVTRERASAFFDFVRQVSDPDCFQTRDVECVTTWAHLTRDGRLLTLMDDRTARVWDPLGTGLQLSEPFPEDAESLAYIETLDAVMFFGDMAAAGVGTYVADIVPLDGGERRRGGYLGVFQDAVTYLAALADPRAVAFSQNGRLCPFVLLDLDTLENIASPNSIFFPISSCDWVMFDETPSPRVLAQFSYNGGQYDGIRLDSTRDNTTICVVGRDATATDAAFNGEGGFHLAVAGDAVAYDGECNVVRTDHLHEAQIESIYQLDETRMLTHSVDGVVKIWSAANGAVERELSGLPRTARIVGWSAAPDALLILDADQHLYVWSGEPRLGAYVGPSAPVCAGDLSADADTLYARRCDGVLEVWRRRES